MTIWDIFRKKFWVEPTKLTLKEIDYIAIWKKEIDSQREEFERRFDEVLEKNDDESRKNFLDFAFRK